MRSHFKLLASLFLISTLSACSGIQPQHQMDPSVISNLNDVETYLIVEQDEIYADINGSNIAEIGGGGLLLALIDIAVESSQTSSAETSIQPIRDHLLDYDYATILQKSINDEITKIDRFTVKEASLERTTSSNLYNEKHSKSDASAVLFLQAKYNMSPDFSTVYTTVDAFMFPNSDSLNAFKEMQDTNESHVDLSDNIYHNTFTQSQALNTSTNLEENISLINDSPDEIKLALEKNALAIASQIKNDLQK